tara:strand:- start:313 stop:528 length:216 start_codon:yes stop_codon:yes gene_type:complete
MLKICPLTVKRSLFSPLFLKELSQVYSLRMVFFISDFILLFFPLLSLTPQPKDKANKPPSSRLDKPEEREV